MASARLMSWQATESAVALNERPVVGVHRQLTSDATTSDSPRPMQNPAYATTAKLSARIGESTFNRPGQVVAEQQPVAALVLQLLASRSHQLASHQPGGWSPPTIRRKSQPAVEPGDDTASPWRVQKQPSMSSRVRTEAAGLADNLRTNDQEAGSIGSEPTSDLRFWVGDEGLEPPTSSV
jgi:hypothetical protein